MRRNGTPTPGGTNTRIMSRLYVRVMTGFYTHRKTARLRAAIGDDAFWVPPRLWAYAAENQPDGNMAQYGSEELALLLGCPKHATSILEALKVSGFMDSDGKIHDWTDHNGYHERFSIRAKIAADVRWNKKKKVTKEENTEERGNRTVETSIACSMLEASEEVPPMNPKKKEACERELSYHKDARSCLFYLREATNRDFRENDTNLTIITARLRDHKTTFEDVKLMIDRQCKLWKGTPREEYLRPATLFGKEKFDGYFAARLLPIHGNHANANKENPRNAGIAPDPGNSDRIAAKVRSMQADFEKSVQDRMAAKVAGA